MTKIDVLGSSLGGSMAQAFTLRHPDMVRSLIVIGAIFGTRPGDGDEFFPA